MKQIFTTALALLLVVLLSGCATKAYLPTHADSPEYGTVTLIRTNNEQSTTAPKLKVYVKDKKVALIREQTHVTFSLPKGTHRLTFDWPNTDYVFENHLTVKLKEQEHKYYFVNHTFGVSDFTIHPRKYQWLMSEQILITEVSKTVAVSFIQNRGTTND